MLVGTQIDLRDDAATIEKLQKNKQRPLTQEAGEKLQKDLRAVKYVECSALTQVRKNLSIFIYSRGLNHEKIYCRFTKSIKMDTKGPPAM